MAQMINSLKIRIQKTQKQLLSETLMTYRFNMRN